MSVEKSIGTLELQPITTEANSAMNQSVASCSNRGWR